MKQITVDIHTHEDKVVYTITIEKEEDGDPPIPFVQIRSGLLSQHGIAAWVDDIDMEEGDGVYRMNVESVAFALLNAAYILANKEATARDASMIMTEIHA